ncbi:hypothetical protein BKA67DRAFT_529877 [Truncatella angustata]|uniref:Uncharacterized protein n=1 Tax=Truncatella angustata TaxID=152316 RepID=A0A9P8UX11_9PEZI|nr:uncharacterized protein BKA67DRAFT_529877 [Truncatella angustata]KAH6659738.1 hypothetical protein BKA67DRAFT_529877 [Truncatella angustata]
MSRRQYAPTSSNHTTSTRDSRRSDESYDQYSYDSRSTAPSSLYDNLGSTKASSARNPKHYTERYNEDLSPSTSLCPRSSVETYSSKASADEIEDTEIVDIVDDTEVPPLPIYRHEITDSNVRPSSAQDFAALFPSMNRLSIRHDDFTSDGNMNLRVDTIVSGRRRRTVQLFHLRMYDLNKREFSLRRYCRDSGREVCNSKRKYTEPGNQSRPTLQRSVSSAMKSFTKPQLKRTPTGGSVFSTKSRPETSHSANADTEFSDIFSQGLSLGKITKPRQTATNSIKLEFSNYARVDVERCGSKGSKRYEFAWWGHDYIWKRVTDKLTGVVSFHLFRDGPHSAPVAHIVPETRSPNQVASDENAGGWVPPCHMWLSDKDLIDAATDVADIVVATGLMALVDDCIKQRWSTKHTRQQRITLPKRSKTLDYDDHARPRSLVHKLFSRRHSDHSSPLQKTRHPVVAY